MGGNGVTVRVNVFDLVKSNQLTRDTKLCVYHTSVVIDEQLELYFGFKSYGICGIDTANKIDELPSSMNGTFYQTYMVGKTKRSFEYCKTIIARMKQDPQWMSDRYNIVYHNCHNFAWALCESLLGKGNMHKFPKFVFDCDKFSSFAYESFIKHFVDEENPPYFLGKQIPMIENSKKASNTIVWSEPNLAREILAY